MKVRVHEGPDTSGILGVYECVSELMVGITVGIPSGATYRIDSIAKTQTIDSGVSLEETSIFCTRSSGLPSSGGVVQLIVPD